MGRDKESFMVRDKGCEILPHLDLLSSFFFFNHEGLCNFLYDHGKLKIRNFKKQKLKKHLQT